MSEAKDVLIRRDTSPEYHPRYDSTTIAAIRLIQLRSEVFKSEDGSNAGLIDLINEFEADPHGSLYGGENSKIESQISPVYSMLLDVAGVPGSKRGRLIELALKYTPILFDEKSKASDHFRHLLKAEHARPVDGELGRNSMAYAYGVHSEYLDVTEVEEPNGRMLKKSVLSAVYAVLENQTVWDPKLEPHAKNILSKIGSVGWQSVIGGLEDPEQYKGIANLGLGKYFCKDIKRRFGPNNEIIRDTLALQTMGVGAIKIRVFSENGARFTDIPVTEYASLSDYDAEAVLESTSGFERFTWKDSQKEMYENPIKQGYEDWPLLAVSKTTSLSTKESKVHKYLASDGRNAFHFNLVDAGPKGKLIELASGHTRVNGSEVAKLNDAISKYLGLDNLPKNSRFKMPKVIESYDFFDQSTPKFLKEFGMANLGVVVEFDNQRWQAAISKINDKLVSPKSKQDKLTAVSLGVDEDVAIKVRNILNSLVGRHQIFSMVMSEFGPSVFVALTDPQKQKEMSIVMCKRFPEGVARLIKDNITNINDKDIKIDIEMLKKEIDGIKDAITKTTIQQAAGKIGISTISYIQGFVQKSREFARVFAGAVHKKISDCVYPQNMISDVGEGAAIAFNTSQNRDAKLSRYFGFINNVLMARVNLATRQEFNSIDFRHKFDISEVEQVLSGHPFAKSRAEMVESAARFYRDNINMLEDYMHSNITKVSRVWADIDNAREDDLVRKYGFGQSSHEIKKALKQGLIDYAVVYEYKRVEKAVNTSIALTEAIADLI